MSKDNTTSIGVDVVGIVIIAIVLIFGVLKGCEYQTIENLCKMSPDSCQQIVAEFKGK